MVDTSYATPVCLTAHVTRETRTRAPKSVDTWKGPSCRSSQSEGERTRHAIGRRAKANQQSAGVMRRGTRRRLQMVRRLIEATLAFNQVMLFLRNTDTKEEQ